MNTDRSKAVIEIAPQVVRIETAHGYRTGFICYAGEPLRTVATAYHVIDNAANIPLFPGEAVKKTKHLGNRGNFPNCCSMRRT